jgi:hypothetical protein
MNYAVETNPGAMVQFYTYNFFMFVQDRRMFSDWDIFTPVTMNEGCCFLRYDTGLHIPGDRIYNVVPISFICL